MASNWEPVKTLFMQRNHKPFNCNILAWRTNGYQRVLAPLLRQVESLLLGHFQAKGGKPFSTAEPILVILKPYKGNPRGPFAGFPPKLV
jgi:hypothetical protein